jgi:hypothetical protein
MTFFCSNYFNFELNFHSALNTLKLISSVVWKLYGFKINFKLNFYTFFKFAQAGEQILDPLVHFNWFLSHFTVEL